jgi:hypothetical protein
MAADRAVETRLVEELNQAKIRFDAAMENPGDSVEIARAGEAYKSALSRFSAFVFESVPEYLNYLTK